MERLLSVFDQSHVTSDGHRLNIREEDYSGKYGKVIRRLQRAILEPEMRDKMDVEDDILEELQGLERAIAGKDREIEENKKALEENKKALDEKDKIIEELKKRLSGI